MYDWVRALLDPTDIVQSPSSAKKQITPPPKFEIPEDEPEMPQRRRGRSASPSKQSPRKSRTTRVGKDVMGTPSTNAANASLHSALEITAGNMDTETVPELAPVRGETQVKSTGSPEKKSRSRKTKSATTAEPEEEAKEEEETNEETKEEKKEKNEEKKEKKKAEKKTEKKIEKKNEVKDKEEKAVPSVEVDAPEDVKTSQTTVSLDMPISLPEVPSAAETEAMIAQAKGMESVKVTKKRKPEEDDEETSAESTQRAKKAKVLENKLREERVRNRSIFGVSVAFALA
jgi:hypothetical protein